MARNRSRGIEEGLTLITDTMLAGPLKGLPALAVLEWLEVPVLAMATDGSIVFANWAFADLIGYTPEMVQGLTYEHVFGPTAGTGTPMAVMRANAHLVIELGHLDGSVVQVKVSEPFLVSEDGVALATFHDMSEQLWPGEF
ncbi:MAG: PAS domain-containing protein [Mycobacterium sp.]